MDCSTPGLPVPYQLLEFAQVHVHCIGDACLFSPLQSRTLPWFVFVSYEIDIFEK